MDQPIWVAVILNRLLGKPATALLQALHITPSNPDYPIPNPVSMEILVFIVARDFLLVAKGPNFHRQAGGNAAGDGNGSHKSYGRGNSRSDQRQHPSWRRAVPATDRHDRNFHSLLQSDQPDSRRLTHPPRQLRFPSVAPSSYSFTITLRALRKRALGPRKALSGTDLCHWLAYAAHRAIQPFFPPALTDRPVLGQHAGERDALCDFFGDDALHLVASQKWVSLGRLQPYFR